MSRAGSLGLDGLQVFANHTGAYWAPPVTLVLDMSTPLLDEVSGESAPTYLYAQNEHENLKNVCRDLRGVKALPSEGMYSRDHNQMIRHLQDYRAWVQTLVVVLPIDDDDLGYYMDPPDDFDPEIHDMEATQAVRTEAMRTTTTVVVLQDVMRFAAPTAERVAIFNAGARLVLVMNSGENNGVAPEKPLALALRGARFSNCRELVVSRTYNISYHVLTNHCTDSLNHELGRHISPFWHICPETFPKVQSLHMVADRINISTELPGLQGQEYFCNEIRRADAQSRPRPNIGQWTPPGQTSDVSAPYFGRYCTITKYHGSYANHDKRSDPVPESPELPAMYMHVYRLIDRVQGGIPGARPYPS